MYILSQSRFTVSVWKNPPENLIIFCPAQKTFRRFSDGNPRRGAEKS